MGNINLGCSRISEALTAAVSLSVVLELLKHYSFCRNKLTYNRNAVDVKLIL